MAMMEGGDGGTSMNPAVRTSMEMESRQSTVWGEGAVEDLRGPSPGGALSGGSVAAAKVGCLLCEIRSRK
jgi:hypothetical protein